MKKYIIYTLENPETGEIKYVGKTSEKLNFRLNKHTTTSELKKRNKRTNWIKSLKKKNLKPIIKELDIANSNEESIILEIYWISQFKNWGFKLVNGTDGGEGSVNYKHSNESKKKISKNSINCWNTIWKDKKKPIVKKMSKEEQAKHLSNKYSIEILQYDLNGNFIKEWKSTKEAAKNFQVWENSLWRVIKEKTISSCGYVWRLKMENYPLKISVRLPENRRLVYVYNLENKLLYEFSNCQLASKKLNIIHSTLLNYIKSGKIYKNKYIFKTNK